MDRNLAIIHLSRTKKPVKPFPTNGLTNARAHVGLGTNNSLSVASNLDN